MEFQQSVALLEFEAGGERKKMSTRNRKTSIFFSICSKVCTPAKLEETGKRESPFLED